MIQNVKIVVVDNDKMVRDFTVDVLLEFCVNREVRAFENGRDAWEFIQSADNAHLIIADADIPHTQRIRTIEKHQERVS